MCMIEWVSARVQWNYTLRALNSNGDDERLVDGNEYYTYSIHKSTTHQLHRMTTSTVGKIITAHVGLPFAGAQIVTRPKCVLILVLH